MILDGKSAIIVLFYIRRCVGMADEGDSKSLVLITRVGSTPTTGIEKQLRIVRFWAVFLFYPPHPARFHTFVSSGKILTMALAEDTLLEKSRCV